MVCSPPHTVSQLFQEQQILIRDQIARTAGLTTGYGSSGTTVGPELGFGHVIGDSLENPVLLVKCSWGGKSLALGTNSGWQSATAFIDSSLQPATHYTFTVQARDRSFHQNASAPSACPQSVIQSPT